MCLSCLAIILMPAERLRDAEPDQKSTLKRDACTSKVPSGTEMGRAKLCPESKKLETKKSGITTASM